MMDERERRLDAQERFLAERRKVFEGVLEKCKALFEEAGLYCSEAEWVLKRLSEGLTNGSKVCFTFPYETPNE